ncbi:MAG: Fpg/Nei family DNA glycosylase [Planctomycetaceae bacterium]|nr:Fpg/Nei family DNA glycosylase [Planctomycetaceae bacterium]
MPEGHTIHRHARDQSRFFAGHSLSVSSPQGRFHSGAKKLDGGTLETIDAYGKHLFYQWEEGQILHVHLGLYGKFRIHKHPIPEPRGQVRLRVVSEERAFDLNGPTACELLSPRDMKKILDRLGPDPLRKEADVDWLKQRVQNSKAAIGSLLLNQSVIAGVGNVYRAEVLHLLGIHPERKGQEISDQEFERLWETIVELLNIGVKYNRIIINDPQDVGKPRSRMNRSERLRVYKKEFCPVCDSEIESWKLASRTIYACPVCQS